MAEVRVNERGRRIGAEHQNARHSDEIVEWAVEAYGVLKSYAKVAAAVGAKKSTVRDWVKGARRGQVGPRVSERDPMVNAHYRMRLSKRQAILRRGGTKWLLSVVDKALKDGAENVLHGTDVLQIPAPCARVDGDEGLN